MQGDAPAANRVFDENHRLYKLLRTTAEGRAAIGAQVSHANVGVRLLAATHSLAWAPETAVAVLEAIEAGPGLYGNTAKYTLRSYRAGSLDLDW